MPSNVRLSGRRAVARPLLTAAGLTLLASAGCHGDTTGPSRTPSPIAGTYRATRWVADSGSTYAADYIASGWALTLTIAPNDSISGQLTEPRSCNYPDGCHGPLGPQAVTGAAVRSGGTARLQGVFILSDLVFTFDSTSLRADQLVETSPGDSHRYQVALTRQ